MATSSASELRYQDSEERQDPMRLSESRQELCSFTSSCNNQRSMFTRKDFSLIRFLLRLLSLWRPPKACCVERFIYPAFVNLMLLFTFLIRNIIQATTKPTWLSIQSVWIVHEFCIWLGHILANVYFRSRDLETNVFRVDMPLTRINKPLKRKMKWLNCAMVLSLLLFSLMLCTLFVVSQFVWNTGPKRFSSDLLNIHGTVDHILYVLVILSIIYDLGIGLALAWTMALLYVSFASRLKALENVFLTWSRRTVDAIYFFQKVYSRPVKKSWKRISWWFLVHNFVAIAIPLYGYELAQAVQGNAYHSKHLAQLICYLFFVLFIWLAPIAMAEQIKRVERKFEERVNNFCPGVLRELTDHEPQRVAANDFRHRASEAPSGMSVGSTVVEEDFLRGSNNEYTFAGRGTELREFLRFLKRRRPGLVSHGYSLQLNISLISLFSGIVSFLVKLHGQAGAELVDNNKRLNSTLF